MQFSITSAVLALSVFAGLAAGEACVTGGPTERVDVAEWCCYAVAGKWFQKYPAQGICVFQEVLTDDYNACVTKRAEEYLPTCIECDETKDCGLD